MKRKICLGILSLSIFLLFGKEHVYAAMTEESNIVFSEKETESEEQKENTRAGVNVVKVGWFESE